MRRPGPLTALVTSAALAGLTAPAGSAAPSPSTTADAAPTSYAVAAAAPTVRERRVIGRSVRGVDLWVVPTYNPDGLARGTRTNARGVDLNRNFPQRWRDLDGRYESGPRPASEPETRAVMRFLDDVDPRWVVSFHQPLHGVDTDTERPAFARRLATELRLPRRTFDCGGVCHGTMTMWFNAQHRGVAVTVEYGRAPGRHRMRVEAPRQLLRALGGSR